MTSKNSTPELRAELADLRARLAEAEETLRAIRGGEVDALLIAGKQGSAVHLLGAGDRIYRQFMEAVSEGTATLSAAGAILSCNAALAKTLRRPLGQLLGSAMRDHVSPDDQETFGALLAPAGPESNRRKISLKTSEGHLVPVYVSATLLQSAGGEPVTCLVFADLEEVVSAEMALRESETLLREAQIVAGLGTYVLDIPTGRWKSSDVMDKLFGIGEAYERTVEGWLALIHPDDRAGMADYFSNKVLGQGRTFDRDYRIIRLDDQSERWVHGLGRLACDAHGRPLKMHGTIQDITERKEAEARILQLAQLYAGLSQCNAAVARSANEDELFLKVCRNAVQFGGMKMAWIGLVEEASQLVRPVASYGEGTEYLHDIRISVDAGDPFGRGPTGTSIRENRPFWCQDFLHDPVTAPWRESGERYGWAALASLPLLRGGKPVGSLTIYAARVNAFDEGIRLQASDVARNISFALDKYALEAERHRAEQALRESEERYRALFENIPDAVLLTIPDGRIISANPAACRMFGRTEAELCALGRGAVVDTRDPRLPLLLEERGRTGRASGELAFLRRDGSSFPGEVSSLLFKDSSGATQTSMIVRDITERKRAEEELGRVRRQYELILHSAGEGIVGMDVEGKLTFVNPAAEEMLGFAAEELLGKSSHAMWHHSRPDGAPYPEEGCPFLRARREGRACCGADEVFWRKDGTSFPVEYTVTPLREGDAVTGGVMIFRDITNDRMLQEAQVATRAAGAANRAKSDFLANMSHELRTPLNSIIGFSDILDQGLQGGLTPEQAQSVRDIGSSGRHLLSLINDILDLSKVEAGRMELEPEEVDVGDLIRNLLTFFREKALKHRLAISAEVADGTGLVVADARKVKQVIINLLDNAVKFTPDGGSIRVRARRVAASPSPSPLPQGARDEDAGASPGGTFVEIAVEDTGIGISLPDQKKLFQPFQQVQTQLTREFSGTGLGLSLCRGFVELHGGTIRVESEPGRGSVFTFTLPVEQPAKPEPSFAPAAASCKPPPSGCSAPVQP